MFCKNLEQVRVKFVEEINEDEAKLRHLHEFFARKSDKEAELLDLVTHMRNATAEIAAELMGEGLDFPALPRPKLARA